MHLSTAAAFLGSVTTGANRCGMSLYVESSTRLGSIRTSLTCSGVDVNRILARMVLIQTLLPDPVAPATSKCGNLGSSVTTAAPAMSLPSTTFSRPVAFWNSGLSKASRIVTIAISLFGTSIPTAALPGIGASIRNPLAASANDRSSANATILLTFTPAAGCMS